MINKIPAFPAVIFAALLGFAGIAEANSEGENRPSSVEPAIIVTLTDFTKTVNADRTVKTKRVTFKNQELKMAGVLFSPADMDESKKYPAIVVVHPGGGSKDQTASLYA
jgi:uncharacterized protein